MKNWFSFYFAVRFFLTGILLLSLYSCGLGYKAAGIEPESGDVGPGGALIRFYRGPLDRLSSVRRGTCPMYPSCSEYASQCFATRGFLMGYIMTMDRLLRCGHDETVRAPRIIIGGSERSFDPLESNLWPRKDSLVDFRQKKERKAP